MDTDCNQMNDKDDYYDRLPQELKDEMAERERMEREQAVEYYARLRKQRRKAAIFGAVVAVILGLLTAGFSPVYLIVFAAAQAGAAYWIVSKQLNHLLGMLIFGGSAVAVSLIFIASRVLFLGAFMAAMSAIFMFVSWLICIGLGIWLSLRSKDIESAQVTHLTVSPSEERKHF